MDKITLELTRGEILMIQELSSGIDCDYRWQQELAERINKKANDAYQKPTMNAGMFHAMLEAERAFWAGESVENDKTRAKESEIRFFYNVEEEQ